ncbi:MULTISPECIES: hypothetical protein [unclassified Nonomuraea]|uniref:hypothetical protein n=1 Tax=unclassified Nonomuraea TaxID=2593643 RepID=UPI0033F705F2
MHREEFLRLLLVLVMSNEAAEVADALAHFGMAGFDGAFVSLQSGDGKPIQEFMEQLADALAGIGESLIAGRRGGPGG